MTIHAKITAYKGIIVCELVTMKSIDGELTSSVDRPGVIGQVIHNTKEHLGVSPEAIALLKKVKRCSDDLGDIDWFKSNDGHGNFAWLGGPYATKRPEDIEGSRSFHVMEDHYVEIANDVPEGAKAFIDSE